MKSGDVTVCEELGHGAFGKVFKGMMKPPPCITQGLSVKKSSKKKAESSITVAVKMLQGGYESGVLDLSSISLFYFDPTFDFFLFHIQIQDHTS